MRNQFRGDLNDFSGTTTGSSVPVIAANNDRHYLLIVNISAGTLYANFGAAASTTAVGSIPVAAGGSLVFEDAFIPTNSVNIIGTAGLKYTVKEA